MMTGWMFAHKLSDERQYFTSISNWMVFSEDFDVAFRNNAVATWAIIVVVGIVIVAVRHLAHKGE